MTTPVLRWIRPGLNDHARRTALAVISPAERQRHDSMPDARRDGFLAGRLLLRRLAGELTNLEPAAVELVAPCPDCGQQHGKPIIPDSRLHLSLTHSADAIVAAASWDAAVGIDAERDSERVPHIAGVTNIEEWRRVEAILKADGRGLRVDPSQVVVEGDADQWEGWVVGAPTHYRGSELEVAAGIRVTMAVAVGPDKPRAAPAPAPRTATARTASLAAPR